MSCLKHLFLVEDDLALRQMLSTYLVGQGLESTAMSSAEELFHHIDHIDAKRPDLVVLDIGLPGMSGLEACKRLRQRGDPIAIILLTARTDPVDRIVGLETGADDYLDKPFAARELLARARAVVRRGRHDAPTGKPAEASIRLGDWSFQPGSRSLHRGQAVRMLNATEFSLLAELTAHPGLPVTRERLLAVSHPNDKVALFRTVDASIMRLRRLFERDPSRPRYIQTVRHRGYMFVPHKADAPLP